MIELAGGKLRQTLYFDYASFRDQLVSCNIEWRHKSDYAVGLKCALGESRDAREDLVGSLHPNVGFTGLIVHCDELLDRFDQLADATVRTPAEPLRGQC